MSEWREYKLGEICSITSSKRIFYKEYVSHGIPFYRSKEIIEKSKGSKVSTELFISEERYNKIKINNGVPREGDILITSVGTLGVAYQVTDDDQFYFKDGNLTWLKDFKSLLNPKYILYWIRSEIGKESLRNITIGSTQAAITIQGLKGIRIKIPDLPTQTAIAEILSSLDDKIELNNEINKNLEALAQALFKHWFVDFEFPDENGQPYKSSGGEMVESELGLIPMGWGVEKLSEVMEIKYGKDHKHLNDGKIPVYGSGGVMRYVNKYIYEKESILIPRKGTLSNLFYLQEPFWSVDTMFYSIIRIPYYAKYLYYCLRSFNLASMNVGSAVPSMTTKVLNNIDLIIPSDSIIIKFDEILTSLFNTKVSNTKENKTLIKLRDTLLPKLISGELEVKEALKQTEKVL